MFYTLAGLTVFLSLITLLPVFRFRAWPIRILDFPRLQIATLWLLLIVALLVFLPLPALSTQALFACALPGLTYQLWWIIPYTPMYKKEVLHNDDAETDRTISIITANVLTPNRGADRLLQQVRDHQPDILVTLESDSWWQNQLDTLSADYPYTLKCPLDNLYGMHLYSRLPLHDARIEFLVEDDKPSMHAEVELDSGERVRCHFLHPAPPSPTENSESTERDVELLIVAENLADYSGPAIVTGDLNDVAWSRTTRTFRKISGLLDPRIGRGMFNTFHAKWWCLRWPLDHLFHSDHFTLVKMNRLQPFGSDHFALEITLAYSPAAGKNQTGIKPDADDEDFSHEVVSQDPATAADVPEPGK